MGTARASGETDGDSHNPARITTEAAARGAAVAALCTPTTRRAARTGAAANTASVGRVPSPPTYKKKLARPTPGSIVKPRTKAPAKAAGPGRMAGTTSIAYPRPRPGTPLRRS